VNLPNRIRLESGGSKARQAVIAHSRK
jgi:hypothetical protein